MSGLCVVAVVVVDFLSVYIMLLKMLTYVEPAAEAEPHGACVPRRRAREVEEVESGPTLLTLLPKTLLHI